MVGKWVTLFLQFKNTHSLFLRFAYFINYDWDMVDEK